MTQTNIVFLSCFVAQCNLMQCLTVHVRIEIHAGLGKVPPVSSLINRNNTFALRMNKAKFYLEWIDSRIESIEVPIEVFEDRR